MEAAVALARLGKRKFENIKNEDENNETMLSSLWNLSTESGFL